MKSSLICGALVVSNARRNAVANYINTGVTALLGLAVNPLLLSGLGEIAFGAWKAIQRLLDFGTAGDGGAGQSLKWVVAHRSETTDDEKKRRDVGAALRIALLWAPGVLAASALIVVLLPVLIAGVPDTEMTGLYWAGLILAVNVTLTGIVKLPDAVLVGTNQGFRSTYVTTVALIATNGSMVLAAMSGMGTSGLAMCVLAGTIINGALTLLVARRFVTWWGVRRPTRADIRSVIGLSGWTMVWGISSRVLLATEIILLGALAGASVVAAYTFTSYVLQFALTICLMTTSALMPKLGALLGANEMSAARTLALEARELTIAVATGAACMTILLNHSFVSLWVDSSQFLGQSVNILMAIALVQLALIRADGQINDAGLNVRSKVLWGVAMIVASLGSAASCFLVFGNLESLFIGMIAGRLIGSIAFARAAKRALGGGAWPIARLVGALAAVAVAVVVAQRMDESPGVLDFLLSSVVAALTVGSAVWFLLLSKSTRKRIKGRASK